MNNLLQIDPKQEIAKISKFIQNTLQNQNFKNVVIGMSGGIDSTVCLSLLAKSISPKNIYAAHLYYFDSEINSLLLILKTFNIPEENVFNISIKSAVDNLRETLVLRENSKDYFLRLGNIMARVRMVILYDLAKKHTSLVCGTENKSEFYLGYFTRFGDEASDFEPIKHLYKTQIYQLADYLKIPKEIISLPPTAGLYLGQTDEKDFGFSYMEADEVLYLYVDKKKSLQEIISKGFRNAKKIIDRVCKNSFKHNLPYTP